MKFDCFKITLSRISVNFEVKIHSEFDTTNILIMMIFIKLDKFGKLSLQ